MASGKGKVSEAAGRVGRAVPVQWWDGPPRGDRRKTLDRLPGSDPLGEEYLRHFAEKYGPQSKLEERIRKAKAITPPPFWQEFLRLRGDCDVDLDDPVLLEALSRSLEPQPK